MKLVVSQIIQPNVLLVDQDYSCKTNSFVFQIAESANIIIKALVHVNRATHNAKPAI